jgi:hypothetical protein
MAKFKAAKPKRKVSSVKGMRGAIPCLILMLSAVALLTLLFTYALRSGS